MSDPHSIAQSFSSRMRNDLSGSQFGEFLFLEANRVQLKRNVVAAFTVMFISNDGPRSGKSPTPVPVAGSGEIINTSHGFTIELDIHQFNPEEIKIVLTDDLLSVSGERLEYNFEGQTLRRSFSRKYSIPEDVHLDTIRSYLTNSGLLIVTGSRKGWRETSISTHPALPKHHHNGKTSSTV